MNNRSSSSLTAPWTAFAFFLVSLAGLSSTHAGLTPVDQWEVAEFNIELSPNGENPFDRLPLMDLEGPGDESFSVPGYYVGDGKYGFRVSLPTPGDWKAESRESSEEWTFRVAADADALGPLTIPEDKPQTFRYANGEDCFMLAFEADWLFALDLETGNMDRTRTLLEDNRYFDYVVARYQGFPNVLWDISKEATGYGHNDMDYIVRRTERLRKLDSHDRLLTVHAFNYCVKHPDTVDFMSTQNWTTSIYERMLDAYQKFEDKPIFNIEHGGYEKGPYHVFDGDYDDAVACVDRNYRCAFAGAYSCYYWQDTSWSVVIWDQTELPKKQRPRYDLYRNMAKLFNDVDYGKYRPFDRRTERRTSSGYVMGDDEGNFLIYLPAGNSRVTTTFSKYYDKPMKAKWFNAVTGEYSKEEDIVVEKWLRFEAPWQGVPRVLVLSQP